MSRILCAAILMVGTTGAVTAQDNIVLRGITPWQADYDLSRAFFIFEELVEERFGDRVQVEYLGGPEVAEPNDQFAALRNGVVDVLLGAAAYYRSDVPLSAAVQFTSLPPSELRTSGYYDLMRDIHEDAGVVYLANTAGGNQFRMYLVDEITEPDFTGLTLRGSPVYVPLIEALGGAPLLMAPGDVYTALERGMINGYGWTYTGLDVFGWHEHSSYVIDHPFYSLDGALLVNQEVWDDLPEDVQAGLEEVGVELERAVEAYMGEKLEAEDDRLAELGMSFITFSEEGAQRYLDAAMEAGWADFLARNEAIFAADPTLAESLLEAGN
jgi:TRAP-type C4-dicarboxylate transport system substrate-binding protein